MKKNNTAAQSMNQNINKGAMMNATQELALVTAAKAGDIATRNELFYAYETDIKKAHATSARGKNPKKFGKGYNKKGYDYVADSGRLFEVFTAALEKFDPSLVDMSKIKNVNPFLSYLKYEINHRALDEVRKETTYFERTTTFSELSKLLSKSVKDKDLDGSELMEAKFNRSEIYDGESADRREEEMQQVTRQLISLSDEGSMERKTLETFLEVLGYEKNVIPAIAAKMHVSKPTVYKYIDLALAKLPTRMAQEFRDLLAA